MGAGRGGLGGEEGVARGDEAGRRRAVRRAARGASPLLPGAVVEPDFRAGEGVEKLFAALDTIPGAFGVGLDEGAALLVRGREMAVVGEGAATVLLAKSPAKPRRVLEITADALSDYTMLRRAAIARADAPFPPKEPTTPEVPKGALVIVGGGGMPADVTKKFIDLAGGPDARIVVLPTASPGATGDEGGFFKKAGAKNVVALPAVTLEEVEDPKNLEILKKADAIWFGGGRQWHFVDAYEGTKAEELFRDVLRRGGAIGGNSAGATIQGDYLCRGSPLNNTDEMCEGYERGFGFLPGVGIDQHFSQRNRFADMTSLMKAYPRLLGIGLDEATAIVVQGHEAAVMGKGTAHFYDGGKPVAAGQPDYDSVKAGGRYDLKERKVARPRRRALTPGASEIGLERFADSWYFHQTSPASASLRRRRGLNGGRRAVSGDAAPGPTYPGKDWWIRGRHRPRQPALRDFLLGPGATPCPSSASAPPCPSPAFRSWPR